MDFVMDLMIRLTGLIYDVNRLTLGLSGNRDLSFVEGAERGIDINKFELKKETDIELYKKRREAFELSQRIMMMIQEMPWDEKVDLDLKVLKAAEYSMTGYLDNYEAYQKALDEMNKPGFTVEDKEAYGLLLDKLKETYTKNETAAQYFENMHHYLGAYRRSK